MLKGKSRLIIQNSIGHRVRSQGSNSNRSDSDSDEFHEARSQLDEGDVQDENARESFSVKNPQKRHTNELLARPGKTPKFEE